MTGSWRLIQDGVVGRLVWTLRLKGEGEEKGTQGGRGKKKFF